MHIGNNIKKIRELKGYDQKYMAKQLGVSQSYYSKLESKEENITVEQVNKVANVLEVSLFDLLAFDEKYVFHFNEKVSKTSCGLVNNYFPSELKDLYEGQLKRIEEQYEKRIKDLKETHERQLQSSKEEIQFLRSQLEKK